MGALIGFIGSIIAKIFADKLLSFVAMKVIAVALFTIIVPLVLNNFLYDIIEIVMNFANQQAGGTGAITGAMSFTGFLGWLVSIFRLPDCLSVLVSALVLRLTLSMIPFVRL
jgi:hypothetical protein